MVDMPSPFSKRFEFAQQTETERRAREIQLLINVVEPDPEYQPFLLTDEASFFDAVGKDEAEIRGSLSFYFGEPFDLNLRLSLWHLVDEIKARWSGWPESP